MTNTEHLAALYARLARETARLASDVGAAKELRTVWIAQCQKEINGERKFLGMVADDFAASDMSDDDLLAALEG